MTKEQTDEYKLDKNHVFKVTKFDDFDKYSKVPDQYVAPEKKPYQTKVRRNMFRVLYSVSSVSCSKQECKDAARLWAPSHSECGLRFCCHIRPASKI